MQNNQKEKDQKSKLLILLLLLITIAAIGITIWALFFRSPQVPLAPDYAPPETEANAETIGDQGDEKLEQPQGGGSVSLTYAKEVTISLGDKQASLLFANPSKSNQDMVVQVVIQDTVIIQSGRLTPGNMVTKLDLLEGAEKLLAPGGYEGKFVVLYYDPVSAEKAILNTEIPLTINVEQ